jgi:hypothetical protein
MDQMTPINFVRMATDAAEECTSKYLWSLREIAYDRAYQRRLKREVDANGEYAMASQSLIALSNRMITLYN